VSFWQSTCHFDSILSVNNYNQLINWFFFVAWQLHKWSIPIQWCYLHGSGREGIKNEKIIITNKDFIDHSLKDCDVLVVDTETRSADSDTAYKKTYEIGKIARANNIKYIYKKHYRCDKTSRQRSSKHNQNSNYSKQRSIKSLDGNWRRVFK